MYFQETQDINGTLKILPKHMQVERMLLKGLEQYGISYYYQAFKSVKEY